MCQIFDKLFIKRFCLPFNADVSNYEIGDSRISSCYCGNYNHACCIVQGKEPYYEKGYNVLSYGFNMLGDISGNQPGIHAEHDAINRLKPLTRKKHLQNINMLVIRISKINKLQNSKPCANCIEIMRLLPEKKGYRIKNIFYSDENGNIIKSNLKNLENDNLHYTKFFRKNKGQRKSCA